MHPRGSLITQAVRGCPEMPPILVTAPCWRVNLHEYTGRPAWAILAHAAMRNVCRGSRAQNPLIWCTGGRAGMPSQNYIESAGRGTA